MLLENIKRSSNFSVGGVIILLMVILWVMKPDFFSQANFNVIAKIVSITALVGLSQMIILAGGGMNVSVGAIGGLVGIVTGGMMDVLGFPVVIAIVVGLATGMLCGVINGLIIAKSGSSGVSSFLTTLATASVFTGLNLGITKATPFYNLPETFKYIGSGSILSIPILLWVMLIVIVIFGMGFKYTSLGRQILAVGGNVKAAELSGILVGRITVISHLLSGLVAGIAAVLLVARLGSAQPDVGSDWMLFSFAAPLIGGTRLAGGKINATGTVLGAIVLVLISNGMVHLNIDVYWMNLIQGLIILAAVAIDRIRTINAERMGVRKSEY
ncbi:MAG: hypothetical protein VR66_02045 [Peptococcaceae bacterium BRH_c23]|nr:MAG: hypothetical protein VR66_02045 [Peptococcaceae bacterium BRH_c23]KJS82860.1 MAG: hypothetical protein JL57_23690 [Desulfosporosinus sp. BICA1-9]